MRFAKWVFLLAGGLGIPMVAPTFFMEGMAERFGEPAVTHPEFYYGFNAVVLVWQFAYLMIGTDPLRYRPMMLLAALAKGSFVATVVALYAAGRVPPYWLGFSAFDGTFALLFVVAYLRTPAVPWPAGARDRVEEPEKVTV